MALADFIQSLQSQDTVYSTPPEPSLRVIPPEKDDSYLKVIPPDGPVTGKVDIKSKPQLKNKPVTATNTTTTTNNMNSDSAEVAATPKRTIKLKLKQKPIPVVEEPKPTTNTSDLEYVSKEAEPTVKSVSKLEVEDYVEKEEKPKELTDEDIFNSTGTEYSKKSIWMEYYYKAKNSRKSNQIVTRMKAGRFTITPDNQVLLLPDYDIVGKDPDDVLKDKWF